MAIKNTVKVMNFHSLLRVDSAKRRAEKYFESETELSKMIKKIYNNKNLILDKKIIKPNSNNPILDIYIGNDYGFCGNFNLSINNEIKNNPNNFKILIGKKIKNHNQNILLKITKDEFKDKFYLIENIINDNMRNLSYSEINIIYNHYNSISNLEFKRKRIFPINIENDSNDKYNEDFVVETDASEMLLDLVIIYLLYEIRIAETNSWAAENVMRQQTTEQSLKKISEIEEEQQKTIRKEKKQKAFQKIIEGYLTERGATK
jgi:F0F1-type ATP synthase gamma subunit